MNTGTKRLRLCLLACALVIAVAIAYQPAWHGGFVWDDDYYVTNNPLLVAPDGLRRIWFSLDAPSQYFPLTYTTFRIERSFWGLNPAGYHLVNILLHAGNALLLWRLLQQLKIPGAFFVSAIFALHPVQVESVAWITERKNVLMGFFFLLTLVVWHRSLNHSPPRARSLYVLSLILYALALSAKSTACTLPIAMMSILWLENRQIGLRALKSLIPFFLLALAMGLLAIWWERYHQGTRGALFVLGPIERLLVATHAVWFYLGKLIWPARLTFIYPQWHINAFDPAAYCWVLATAVLFVTVYLARRVAGRGLEVALAIFIGTLGPVLGFIMLYTFRYTYVADHYQYLACIAPIALAVTGVVRLVRSDRQRDVAVAAGLILLVLLGFLTWRQSATYKDIETLWRTTILRNPGCWMAYNNLGIALTEVGNVDEAIVQYEQSLRLRPGYAQAHYNLGNAFLAKGDVERALHEDKTALELQPNDPDAHVAFANALLVKGDVDLAISHYQYAYELNPDSADAHYNLGHALQQQRDLGGAMREFQIAIRLKPDLMEAHLNLAAILWSEKREAEAFPEFERALALAPQSEKAQLNLGWSLATAAEPSRRDGKRAIALAERGARVFGENEPEALRILAAAYAQDRQFDRATTFAQRALEQVRSSAPELAAELEREIDLYKHASPYRGH
jgi:protein O-mannosyl-transferase